MAYVPRTSIYIPNDMHTNPVYNQWNIYDQIGWGIWANNGNCTAYSWGRFWEPANPTSATDNPPTLSPYYANTWWEYNDGYNRGAIPKLGAVACWYDNAAPTDGGHVAIVEKLYDDGSYDISESGLHAFIFQYTHITNNYYGPTYDFKGFIYNPNADPTPGGNMKKWLMMAGRTKDNDLGRYRRYTRRIQ